MAEIIAMQRSLRLFVLPYCVMSTLTQDAAMASSAGVASYAGWYTAIYQLLLSTQIPGPSSHGQQQAVRAPRFAESSMPTAAGWHNTLRQELGRNQANPLPTLEESMGVASQGKSGPWYLYDHGRPVYGSAMDRIVDHFRMNSNNESDQPQHFWMSIFEPVLLAILVVLLLILFAVSLPTLISSIPIIGKMAPHWLKSVATAEDKESEEVDKTDAAETDAAETDAAEAEAVAPNPRPPRPPSPPPPPSALKREPKDRHRASDGEHQEVCGPDSRRTPRGSENKKGTRVRFQE
eukprot:gnl/TRDRNA2_/TRDRNA2_184666_c0_seq1.p1 gnl/TRDRNA2_/TRDRNA2_184666_c0~~gnl/TRDRNA2_/TRDRNA2_184666_c0_seq1.p1  ORF type:complete len:292 (+),score=41.06 gnl/TRDRNA2_/TRDRNA2_184666_c0_seq1:84-959(+)